MSNRHFSPLRNVEKFDFKKINNRPFSSIAPRTVFHNKRSNNIKNFREKESNSIKYYIENNIYENHRNQNKITETRNRYNKLHKKNLLGKEKYTNFTIFIKREMNFKEKNSSNIPKKLTRQHSAIQLNPRRMYKDNPLYLTETIIKKHHKKNNNLFFNNQNNNINNNNNNDMLFPYIDFGDKEENIIINNHKYKNISLLRRIENEKKMNKTSCIIEPDKNIYLFQKKLEYISLNKKKGQKLYNYMEELNEFINKKYGNRLKAEKAKISFEEYKNQHELIDDKIYSLQRANKLYNDLYVYKFNDYIKFLGKQIDKYNKSNYYLLNEVFILQKETLKLKMRINKLLEDKKFYNKFIFLQICTQEKKVKLPDYYDYILNHTLEEGINYYKGVLNEKEVKHIFDYKKNIIYKDYESYIYQIKIYENENREMLNKLDSLKKEVNRLNTEKKELFDEDEQLTLYLDNKMEEKSKERIDIINKYNLLCNEKNKLLKQIQFTYVNENQINKRTKQKKKRKYSYYSSYFKGRDKNKKNTNKSTNESYNTNNNNRNKNKQLTTKTKSFSVDEQLFLDYNINYDNTQNKNQHTILYYKIRKLFFLLINFIKKEENLNKKEKITTENGLILKMLTKIEDAMNLFIENEKNFNRINKEEIIKIKLKMEKQRKIMKGQRQIAIIKAKYENMKKKLEEKNNKIYFLPNNRKRAISACINKRVVTKKEEAQLIKKKEFEDFLEDFNED